MNTKKPNKTTKKQSSLGGYEWEKGRKADLRRHKFRASLYLGVKVKNKEGKTDLFLEEKIPLSLLGKLKLSLRRR